MIWEQRASQYGPELGSPVVWDYHVIMILVAAVDDNNDTHPTMAERIYVVDFDSTLGTLSSWKDYTSRTFRSDLFKAGIFDTQLQSMFRIISATRFIDQFASDRSHMMETSEEGVVEFKMPPPVYEPIVGPGAKARGVVNNLMDEYVCMTEDGALDSLVLQMDDFLTLDWLRTWQ